MHPGHSAQPPRLSRIRKGLTLTKVRIADDTGAATVTFFNQDYIRDALRTGEDYVFYGAVEGSAGSRSMTNPAFERAECSRFTGRILPVYPLTKGVSNNLLAGLTLRCVEACADETPESLPPEVLRDNGLVRRGPALPQRPLSGERDRAGAGPAAADLRRAVYPYLRPGAAAYPAGTGGGSGVPARAPGRV